MKSLRVIASLSIFQMCGFMVWAQAQPQTSGQDSALTAPAASVPRFVKLSGVVKDDAGKPLAGITGVTVAVYSEQQGGAPLFLETQNVQPDGAGRFTVLLGATKSGGLPHDIFDSGEARWVGIQPSGQAEQPRILLVSVPYALKAADAETLGGLPVTAFVLAPARVAAESSSPNGVAVPKSLQPLVNTADSVSPCSTVASDASAATNSIAMFTATPCTIGGSVLTQSSSGTAIQLPATGTATAGGGFNSNGLDFQASSFDSASSSAVNQDFLWQAEPTGNNSPNASAALSLLFGSNGSLPSETGLSIASNGIVSFATGQTFPGTQNSLSAGTGISISSNTVANTGVLSAIAGGGVAVSAATGNVTFSIPSNGITPGMVSSGSYGINITGSAATATSATTATAATTATSLAATPTQCGSNLFATGIAASGNANCSQPAFSQLSGSVGATQLSGTYSQPLTFSNLLTAAGAAITPTGLATLTKAFNSNPLDLQASSYNSGLNQAATYVFRWQSEATGNNSTNTGATLNLLYGVPLSIKETGISIDRTGTITAPLFNGNAGQIEGKPVDNAMAPSNGQVLAFSTTSGKWEPTTTASGGTITGVTAGTGLSGGGTSGSVTLSLNTVATDARYAQLSAANSFAGNQSVTGNLTATGTVTAPLFNGNAGAIEGKVVAAATPTDGQVLTYKNATGQWGPATTSSSAVLAASSTARFTPASNSFCSLTICNNSVTEANFQVYFPKAATFSNLFARSSIAPGLSNSITVTLKTCTPSGSTGMCAGTAKTLTCTITGASGAAAHNCHDGADSVAVNAGDLVDWAITTTGTPASTTLNIAAEVQ